MPVAAIKTSRKMQPNTPRQKAIIDFLPHCTCIADIGCDHGKLGAYILLSGLVRKLISCDISAPSLQKARDLARELGLHNMEFRCGDGMKVLEDGEVDCAIIAGMGGSTILEIISQASCRPEHIIVQPMNGIKDLKESLAASGYHIKDETVVKEDKRFYRVLLLEKGAGTNTEDELIFPMPAIIRGDEACREYLEHKLSIYSDAVNKAVDKQELERKMELIKEKLKWFK